jgi:hypothetical protein
MVARIDFAWTPDQISPIDWSGYLPQGLDLL